MEQNAIGKTATINLSANSGTWSMRVYYSSYHLAAAIHFNELVAEIENNHIGEPTFDIKHRIYSTNAILSIVAFMEAAINELYQDIFDNYDANTRSIADEIHDAMRLVWVRTEISSKSFSSTLEKYQEVLNYLRKKPFPKGKGIFQDVKLIIKLRNQLTHYKPMSKQSQDTDDLDRALKNKFRHNKLMEKSDNPFFPDKCLGFGCINWSINTAKGFTDEFFSRISIEPHYQKSQLF